MIEVTRKMIQSGLITEEGYLQFVSEASSLRLAPGEWPERISTELWNGQDLVFIRITRNLHGAMSAALYSQELGCVTLSIIND